MPQNLVSYEEICKNEPSGRLTEPTRWHLEAIAAFSHCWRTSFRALRPCWRIAFFVQDCLASDPLAAQRRSTSTS